MLYTTENQKEKTNESFSPNVVNNLGPVTATGTQKFLFWLFVVLTFGIYYFTSSVKKVNYLNRLQNKINESASGIDIQLEKRFDTLTKLVDAVKNQVKFNKEVYENIAMYRSGISNSGEGTNLSSKNEAINKISNGIAMAFENYPDLGADGSIRKLMTEITIIEKEIAAARRLYNSDVTEFNSAIYNFPTNVVVYKKGYSGLNLFKADESKKIDIKISF